MKTQRETPEEVEGTDTPDTTLATLVQWVESAEDEGTSMRERSERDRDYYDGRQLTEQEAAELKKRNQPAIAFNMIKGKIDYLLGLEKNQRTDPKAFPRNPDDEDSAKAATDSIRYVCDMNSMQMIASSVWEGMCVEGAGGVEVVAEQNPAGEIDIVLRDIPWDRMIWDPYSRRPDFSDAKFKGVLLWMDEAELLSRWPDADRVVSLSYDKVSMSSAWDDRPRWSVWADENRKRVRVAQLYWRTSDDDWQYATFTRGGYLDEPAPSPYLDEHGRPECPLEFQSAYVNRENWRYGVVRDLIDPQDEINLRHRKAVHLLSVRQVVAEQGAVQDVDKARQELAKPDGYIEVAPGMRFEVQQTGDLSQGQASLLQEAKSVFQTMGPNAALLGKQGSSASGRAIALSQQGGAMEIGAILDLHRDWRRRVYRAIFNRIKQFWTAEKWVRVTDDERNIRFVGLNRPAVAIDPMTGQPVQTVENDVSRMFVDIVVEEGQDVATLQIEEFQTLADLASKGFPIPPDLLIEASNLRSKAKILERMRGEQGQGAPQQPPPELMVAQMRMQAEQQRAEMDAQLKAAAAQQDAALEREKMAMQAQIEQMRIAGERMAETERMEAEDRRHATKLEMDRQIALINAAAGAMTAQPAPGMPQADPAPDAGAQMNAALLDMMGRLEGVAAMMAAPREIVRGPDGRAVGVRAVV
jgi:hypothetical protein